MNFKFHIQNVLIRFIFNFSKEQSSYITIVRDRLSGILENGDIFYI